MLEYSICDLKSIGAREFRTVPTGKWYTARNGRKKMETVGQEYILTRVGKIETSVWVQAMDEAVKKEGKTELLNRIEAHVRQHCAWLHKDSEIHDYSLECLSSEAYLFWADFEDNTIYK